MWCGGRGAGDDGSGARRLRNLAFWIEAHRRVDVRGAIVPAAPTLGLLGTGGWLLRPGLAQYLWYGALVSTLLAQVANRGRISR